MRIRPDDLKVLAAVQNDWSIRSQLKVLPL